MANGEQKIKYVKIFLQTGLAFSLLYSAISGFINPDSWIGFFPSFLFNLAPEKLLLMYFGSVQIILALWILTGKKIFVPSVLSAIMIFSIVIFNFSLMDVVFRDISIALSACALALIEYKNSENV